jgi:muramidase (phage lysozyme)
MSSAAGRYQILSRYFDAYRSQLGLTDFGPDSQDAIALQMIKECKAEGNIYAGQFDEAICKCSSRWASLPGAGYGQHEHKLDALRKVFIAKGGICA